MSGRLYWLGVRSMAFYWSIFLSSIEVESTVIRTCSSCFVPRFRMHLWACYASLFYLSSISFERFANSVTKRGRTKTVMDRSNSATHFTSCISSIRAFLTLDQLPTDSSSPRGYSDEGVHSEHS
ncbi:hypothetical protein SISNIDRAFT_326641 [Sistotremastrum niveocremeum HHB9708]|uniref:Uncharacterized protein n=1 Tax=Sistotremastrum niveocremeum HHB9708 TaxID=1314777 RepID=A0A164XB15_9AGAM|nr:hypothetical protein SISNIDRAFT_326641 [Sistotremastrum niveocremeum HHB9708]